MPDEQAKSTSRFRAWVPNLSGAAWITIATFWGLILLTLFAWLLAWNNPLWVPWGTYLTPSRAGLLLGLAIAACAAEYLLFRMWFDETPIPNRDLRAGWTAGIHKLRQEGIRPRSLPCFLMLDPLDACDRWFSAGGVSVQRPEAAADSPVQWYFGEEALFLVVKGLGCLGPMARELDQMRRRPMRYVMGPHGRQTFAQRVTGAQTIDQYRSSARSGAIAIDQNADSATESWGSEWSPSEGSSEFSPTEEHSGHELNLGTSTVPEPPAAIDAEAVRDELQGQMSTSQPDAYREPESGHLLADEVIVTEVRVSSTEISRQSRRLAEVCRRLAACRRPVVPVNGICVLLPHALMANLSGSGVRLGQALRHDLGLLQRELQVAAPVSVLLTGAEEDAGIVELIRRDGQEAAAAGELGISSSPGRATPAGIRRFCDGLAQSLQQKIGRKLRDPRCVGRPGVERLFRVLSHVRGEGGRELQAFMTQAFTCADGEEPDVLAGVSLTATGDQPTQRAYARSTYRQLLNNQEFVEWTAKGRRQEQQLRWAATACGGLSALAALALIGSLFAVR